MTLLISGLEPQALLDLQIHKELYDMVYHCLSAQKVGDCSCRGFIYNLELKGDFLLTKGHTEEGREFITIRFMRPTGLRTLGALYSTEFIKIEIM